MAEELKLRRLELDDMFLVSSILDKMELNIDPTLLSGKMTAEEAGMKVLVPLALQAIRRLHMAQDDVRALLARLSGRSEDEIRKLAPAQFLAAVKTVLVQEGIGDFLSSVQD